MLKQEATLRSEESPQYGCFFHTLFCTCIAFYFLDVTPDYNDDFACCSDVTKSFAKKQTIICPLFI